MRNSIITLCSLITIGLSSMASADIVTTGNLVKNNTFVLETPGGSTAVDWANWNGARRFMSRTNVPGYVGEPINTFYGSNTDVAHINQLLDLGQEGINLSLIDSGEVTMDFSFYVGSNYADRDRSRVWINLFDENMALVKQSFSSYFDLNEWSYRQYNDITIPVATRFMQVNLHNDRVDGTWSNSAIALPNVTFSVEDTASGQVALDTYGTISDVPIVGIGALALFGLAGLRRKA
jgi:hypothetical protein